LFFIATQFYVQLIRNNIYIASDFHLGLDYNLPSRQRELIIIDWLDSIISDCKELYLLGDIFDYWFEYKQSIPKGFTRFIGKLAQLSDLGIKIFIFTGNHDMWMFDYFPKEIKASIFKSPQILILNGKKFYLAHGDGLGPFDYKYKFVKKILSNHVCQWLFHRLHPNFGLNLMKYISKRGRNNDVELLDIKNPEAEWLVLHSYKILNQHPDIRYFVYGHRHFPLEYNLKNSKSIYYNLGDWIKFFTYIKIDQNEVRLLQFKV
jgi:UDP-2,3-diacylglucosamine hydrolase